MNALRGVCAAVLTPVGERFAPDPSRAAAYYATLLESGCDALNVLGTTGEAASFGSRERIEFMEAIAASGLPRERMMVGTGAPALADAAELTKAAFGLGFGAALVMPPYFFRGVSDDGVVRWFAELSERTNAPPDSILLYNFPQMTGVAFHPDLVERLAREIPGVVAGLKDSSNDRQLQTALRRRLPGLAVFPSSEEHLLAARNEGMAGCISGSVALWPGLAARVWRDGDPSAQEALSHLRCEVAGPNLIASVRTRVALDRNDDAWRRAVPPL